MSGALRDLMAAVADAIEAELDRLLPAATGPQARLHEAMRYAVLGGGKRLRPMLVARQRRSVRRRARRPRPGSAPRSS